MFGFSIDSELENHLIPKIVDNINKNPEIIKGNMTIHLNKIIENRDYYFNNVFKGDVNKKIYSPINFKRILENATNNFENSGKSDIDPLYILNTFDKLENELVITKHYKSNEVIMMLMRLYLSPNIVIKKHHMTKLAFDWIISTVTELFYSSIAHTGDLVGTIAAQSIG